MGAQLTKLGEEIGNLQYSAGDAAKLDLAMHEILLQINREMGPDEVKLLKSKPICKNIMEAAERNLQVGLEMGDSSLSREDAARLAKEVVLKKAFALKLFDVIRSAIGADPDFVRMKEQKGLSNDAIDSKSMCQDRINALTMSEDSDGNKVFNNLICGRGRKDDETKQLSVTSYDEVSNVIDLFSIVECTDARKPLGKEVDKDKGIESLGDGKLSKSNAKSATKTVEDERHDLGKRTITHLEATHPLCSVHAEPFEVGDEVILRGRGNEKFKVVKRILEDGAELTTPRYNYDIKGRTYEHKGVPEAKLKSVQTLTAPFVCLRTNDAMNDPDGKSKTLSKIYSAVERRRATMSKAQKLAASKLLPIIDKYFPDVDLSAVKPLPAPTPADRLSKDGEMVDPGPAPAPALVPEPVPRPIFGQPLVREGGPALVREGGPALVREGGPALVQEGGVRSRNQDVSLLELKKDATKVRNIVVKLLVTCDREYAKALEELRQLEKLAGFYGEAKHKMREQYKELQRSSRGRRERFGEMRVSAKDILKTFSRAEEKYRKNGDIDAVCSASPRQTTVEPRRDERRNRNYVYGLDPYSRDANLSQLYNPNFYGDDEMKRKLKYQNELLNLRNISP